MRALGSSILALEYLASSPPVVLEQQASWSVWVSDVPLVTLPLLGYGQCKSDHVSIHYAISIRTLCHTSYNVSHDNVWQTILYR